MCCTPVSAACPACYQERGWCVAGAHRQAAPLDVPEAGGAQHQLPDDELVRVVGLHLADCRIGSQAERTCIGHTKLSREALLTGIASPEASPADES